MELKLHSPIPPSVNHYLGYRAILKNGRPLAVSYPTPEATRYKKSFSEYVASEALKQNWKFFDTWSKHLYVDAVFYFPRKRMDCNNYWKIMLDAITESKSVWYDDDIVCERAMGKYIDSANPRIELIVRPVDYTGVFGDASQLETFESGCVGCKKNTRNCTVLRSAKEGRIQPEIHDGICELFCKKK